MFIGYTSSLAYGAKDEWFFRTLGMKTTKSDELISGVLGICTEF
jgi:hypothetical protein